jgi:aryl-alcohol dehydrogenase-like predicted oxidoreductase
MINKINFLRDIAELNHCPLTQLSLAWLLGRSTVLMPTPPGTNY